MKKITAFFLAFLPLFIIVLLFITGMLIKNYTHVFVSAVEFPETSRSLEWGFKEGTHEQEEAPTWQTHVNVLPFNATNPEVYYFSTNEDVLTVNDYGLVTAKDFGEASIYAISKENETLYAKCDFEVMDDEVHRIDVDDYSAEYVSLDQTIDLAATPVPSKHVDGDLSLNYESEDTSVATVAPDGELTAISEGTTNIIVTLNDPKYSWITKSVPVRVGLGVTAMEFKNPTNEVISSREHSIFNDIVTYPEKCSLESEFFGPNDFIYEILSDNGDDIATVDENGKLTFKQPGKVTIRVTCRRNKDLVIEKNIESVFEGYTDVAFNRYNFKAAYADYAGKEIPWSELNWQTFPKLADPTDVTITSFPEGVVEVEESVTELPKLKVISHGSTLLTATAPAADGTTISDVCWVTFTKPITEPFIKGDVTVTGSYNYYLRNNVDTKVLNNPHQKITWEIISGGDYASIDNENETIHFAGSNHNIVVQAVAEGAEPETFTIVCQNSSSPLTTIDISNGAKITIQAGQRYAFKDDQGQYRAPQDDGCFYSLGDDVYIARHGVHNSEYEFESWYAESIKTDLTITEEAVDISFDPDETVYVDNTDKPIDYAKVAHITPSTATDINGNPILLETKFVPENEQAVTIENNSLTFNQPGKVFATSTFGGQDYQFLVCSNYGQYGKFNLDDADGNPVYSGKDVRLSEEKSFYLNGDGQTSDLAGKFSIESRSGNNLVESTISWDGSVSKVKFTISPKAKAYGHDTIIIKSGTFNFYLNITLDDKISSFNVFFKDQKLDSTTTSYTNSLILNVWATPLSKVAVGAFTVTLNGNEEIPVDWTRGTIDLTGKLSDGNNTLTLTASEGGYSESYIIDYQPIPTTLDFSVLGSYEKDGETIIPIECGDTQKTLTILPAGGALVDATIFNNFTIELTIKDQERYDTHPNARGKAYIQDIPVPTNENKGEYETRLSIKYGVNPAKEFKLSREIVSKIEFPGHDNNSMSDQKGLQKVHVFGNKSYYDPQDYDPEEKRGPLLDYYKLPINLYDYKGELIEDDPTRQGDKTKENAFNTLNAYVNDTTLGNFKYKNVDETVDKVNKTDFIAISFTERALYDQVDINDNIFDGHDITRPIRNVNFGVSTWTGSAHADYTFVPVEGVNAYCQEALRDDNNIPIYKVLQTNFGLGPEVQDNAPLTDTTITVLTTVYGNGYTLNFSALNKLGDDQGIFCQHVFNATISGCLDNETDHIAVNLAPDRNEKHPFTHLYYRYSVFKNLLFGINVYNYRIAHIKDCLCYDNKLSSIVASGNDKSGAVDYIEDTVMFNCSSTALMQTPTAKMYFKGFVDVYNFKGKEILKNLPFDIGDLSYLWPVVESTASAAGVLQKTAAGTTAVNSALISVNSSNIYFWDGNQYVQSGKGLPTAFNYVVPYFDVPVEIMGLKPGLWGTLVPNASRPDAPSYYDQFDGEGNLRWDFLNNQLVKIMRPWSPLPYNTH